MATKQTMQYLLKFYANSATQLSLDSLMIADSALYSAPSLALMKDLKWLCRVPLTVAEAKKLVSQLTKEDFVLSELEGYWIAAHTSNYGGVAQRWLVVESETRKCADLRQRRASTV